MLKLVLQNICIIFLADMQIRLKGKNIYTNHQNKYDLSDALKLLSALALLHSTWSHGLIGTLHWHFGMLLGTLLPSAN